MDSDPRSPRRARRAKGRRQLGTYLLQLAWLEGFPERGGWHRLDTGESFAIEGALIARSRRAARTALSEHRDALADAVGDVDHWWMIVDAVLAWCNAPRGVLDLLDHAPRRSMSQARARPRGRDSERRRLRPGSRGRRGRAGSVSDLAAALAPRGAPGVRWERAHAARLARAAASSIATSIDKREPGICSRSRMPSRTYLRARRA